MLGEPDFWLWIGIGMLIVSVMFPIWVEMTMLQAVLYVAGMIVLGVLVGNWFADRNHED